MDEIAILRMLERIIAVLIGGGSIYLGYRLFFHIPIDTNHQRQQGQLELPGIKLVLSKVGPGIFFAAFGSIVVAYSLVKQVNIESQRGAGAASAEQIAQVPISDTSSFTGMGPLPAAVTKADDVTPQQRNSALQTVEMLNCLYNLSERHPDFYTLATPAVREAKNALLLSVWDDEKWGNANQLDGLDAGNLSIDSNSPLLSIYNSSYTGCP